MKNIIVLCLLLLASGKAIAGSGIDVCAVSENQFVNWVGGAASGSAVTATVAGNSYILIITETTVAVATAPAVAPIAAGAAIAMATAYAALKVGCNMEDINGGARAIRDAWVGTAVIIMEKPPKPIVAARKPTTDFFCFVLGGCP